MIVSGNFSDPSLQNRAKKVRRVFQFLNPYTSWFEKTISVFRCKTAQTRSRPTQLCRRTSWKSHGAQEWAPWKRNCPRSFFLCARGKNRTLTFFDPRYLAVRELEWYFALVGEVCVRKHEKLIGRHEPKLTVHRDSIVFLCANSFEQCILEPQISDCLIALWTESNRYFSTQKLWAVADSSTDGRLLFDNIEQKGLLCSLAQCCIMLKFARRSAFSTTL